MYRAEDGDENAEITVEVLAEATFLGQDLQRAVGGEDVRDVGEENAAHNLVLLDDFADGDEDEEAEHEGDDVGEDLHVAATPSARETTTAGRTHPELAIVDLISLVTSIYIQ